MIMPIFTDMFLSHKERFVVISEFFEKEKHDGNERNLEGILHDERGNKYAHVVFGELHFLVRP